MKKAVKFLVVIAMTISANFVNANEATFNVKIVGEMRLRVEVSDVRGSSSVYIVDEDGQVLYRKKFREDLLRMTFDFSELPGANYQLVVKDDRKVRTLPIATTENNIQLNRQGLVKEFFPVIEQNDDTVLVKLLSDPGNDLAIDVWATDGELLVSDKINGELGLIGKKYLFNPGKYAITVKSNQFSNTKYITIK